MTDRHPDKQNGMTIWLTLCDANVTQQTQPIALPMARVREANEYKVYVTSHCLWSQLDLYVVGRHDVRREVRNQQNHIPVVCLKATGFLGACIKRTIMHR